MAKSSFIRPYHYIDKNPVIDKVRTMLQDVGLINKLGIVANLSTMNKATFEGWFDGDVKDPRHSSIARVTESVGYELTLRKQRTIKLDEELAAAKEWRAEQRKKANGKKKPAAKKKKK